jgi:hypothetical protein
MPKDNDPKAPLSSSSRLSLHLVSNLAFLSRLPSHAPARPNGDPFSSLLVPSSDLTSLLSDPDLRIRYRAGRYVAGKNVSLGFPAWPNNTSISASGLAQRCEPKASRSIVAAIALHIGIRTVAAWEETHRMEVIQEDFIHDAANGQFALKPRTNSEVRRVLEVLQPKLSAGSGREAMLIVSEQIDDELKGLVKSTGLTARCLIPYCMMVTLSEQPKKYMNSTYREEMREEVESFKMWLSLRAETVERVIATFETTAAAV